MVPGSICCDRLAAPAVRISSSQPIAFSTRTGSASSAADRPSKAANGASATATGTPSSSPISSGDGRGPFGNSSPCRTTFSLSWLAIEACPDPSNIASCGRSEVRDCTNWAISRATFLCGDGEGMRNRLPPPRRLSPDCCRRGGPARDEAAGGDRYGKIAVVSSIERTNSITLARSAVDSPKVGWPRPALARASNTAVRVWARPWWP